MRAHIGHKGIYGKGVAALERDSKADLLAAERSLALDANEAARAVVSLRKETISRDVEAAIAALGVQVIAHASIFQRTRPSHNLYAKPDWTATQPTRQATQTYPSPTGVHRPRWCKPEAWTRRGGCCEYIALPRQPCRACTSREQGN